MIAAFSYKYRKRYFVKNKTINDKMDKTITMVICEINSFQQKSTLVRLKKTADFSSGFIKDMTI